MRLAAAANAISVAARNSLSLDFNSIRLTTSTHVWFSTQANLAHHDVSLLEAEENKKAILDSKRMKAISRVCQIDPAGKLRPQIIYLMQELGLELDQIKIMARKFPNFSYCTLEGKIRPIVEFLLHLGASKSDIHSIISRTPQLCGLSLLNNIIPTMTFLEGLGVDKTQWPKVLHRSSTLLTCSRQKILSTVDFLKEMGISEENIGKILTRYPNIMRYSLEDKLRPNVEYFRSMGIETATLLYRHPQSFSLSIESNLKPVTEFFLDNGFSIEEIGTMVSRYGPLYGLGLGQSLIPKWEFFVTLDFPKSELVKFPQYFSYNLEKRIKPRYALVKDSRVKMLLPQVLSLSYLDFDKALKRKVAKMRSNEASK
ncbi:hypothetical protein ACFE04_004732 [Oxalis oulophora]